ncbi:hypothetical protein HG537_0B00950 [Torulaspora globosa]|uniref:Transcription initiation factor TFIID subunit 2 n=1 Tax=Torulaspora globosa TaxID=48254 RepID=A0A7H9HNB2_9SACH|nr:hypothetical protein HG537_0B00950 [Torulaspora sp. CBS 2947]
MSYSRGNTPRAAQSFSSHADLGVGLRTFKVAHQRISLDVDLSKHSIRGIADIILIPLVQNLSYVTLDCKEMKIKNVWVENRRCDNYIHDDPLSQFRRSSRSDSDTLYKFNGVEQSHFLREKFADLNEFPEERTRSQLIVKIPSSIKITLQDANSLTNYTPITPTVRGTPGSQEAVFTPISIRIEYELNEPTTGVRFDTAVDSQPHLWNAFTTNSEICCTASYWMPCVNTLDEKCTWEVEISVPRRVKDIDGFKTAGNQIQDSRRSHSKSSHIAGDDLNKETVKVESEEYDGAKQETEPDGKKKNQSKGDEEEEEGYDILEDEEAEEDDTLNKEILVCCSEYATAKETEHATSTSKRTFAFQIFNPVAPHHVGWAVGAFDIWTLPAIQSQDDIFEDERDESEESRKPNQKDTSTAIDDIENNDVIPIQVYTLPQGDIDEKTVLNSTIICQKIMDFYAKEFGSYPFTSYSLVFLPTLVPSTMDFASMTLCNTRLLYPPDMIDTMLSTTNDLAWSLAAQWSGVNITPLEINHIWCCIGMAGYMVFQLMRKLLGNNEFKFRLKMNCEAIVDQDWEKPPIGNTFTNASRPISWTSNDLSFIKLKAPMVLYILDRRMVKTERSFGMSRVLPKIFLQAMSGDLPNNSLSAAHFQYVCERVNRNKLESFFQQWIYGSGVPIFRVTQRFNKKRMMVEMGIRQCQDQELGQEKVVGKDGFCSSSLDYIQHPNKNMTSCFTGSMTIRIHESDGTPYEHIVEVKDVFTKIDIQYNTKYRKIRNKRLQVNKTTNKTMTPDSLEDSLEERPDSGSVQKLGTVLSSSEDCLEWNLTGLSTKTDGNEAQLQNEVFEWIRIDSDFEWICKLYVNQPDYMFASQLQQDSDVEAQFESIRYFEDTIIHSPVSSQVYSSILVRTAMDKRYFYGIRAEACKALARYVVRDSEPNNFSGGARHLIKIFRELFCYENSSIPLNNDFSNFQEYFLQKQIPQNLTLVRNERNETPYFVKQFLLDLLTYNENSENLYDDSHYRCMLIQSVVDCVLSNRDDKEYLNKVLEQLRRHQNLEEWMPTYQLLVKNTILLAKLRLGVAGLYTMEDLNDILLEPFEDELKIPNINVARLREGSQDLTLTTFKTIFVEGGLKNKEALKYLFQTLCFTVDVYMKEKLVDVFISAVDFVALNKLQDLLDDDIDYMVEQINSESLALEDGRRESGGIIEEDYMHELRERKEQKMRSTVRGLMHLLRKQFRTYEPLKKILWEALHTCTLSLYQRKRLFDISRILYCLLDSFDVVLTMPRDKKLVAKYIDTNKVVIKREGLLKVHLPTKLTTKLKPSSIDAIPDQIPSRTNKVKISLGRQPIKLKKSTSAPAKGKQANGIVNRVGILPLRFIKITTSDEKKVDISSVPFSENVQIIKANNRSFTVKIRVPRKDPEA